jgi:hypothetical protein
MAMKLFAHVLRSEIPAVDAEDAATTAMSDGRRWVFRDLVVRREGYAAWGLSQAASATAAKPPGDPGLEPLWADTQPWCHE